MQPTIYTIGHSNLSYMRFVSLIQENHITHIIDIRSIPYSRHAPWSSKSRLAELLRPFKIRYTYLGHKLGGKKQPIDEISKQQGITPQEIYRESISFLMSLSKTDKIALMCAEADPALCHRQKIVAQNLLDRGVTVLHILKDGTIIPAWREEIEPEQLLLL